MSTQEPSPLSKDATAINPQTGTSVRYDSITGYLDIMGPVNPLTPSQAYLFALDIIASLHPVITAGEHSVTRSV